MLSKILNIGINDNLGLENIAKARFQNSIALFSAVLIYFFIPYHVFYTQKQEVATAFFTLSLIIPAYFWFQHNQKYVVAKILLFLFLYIVVFATSMFLLVGHGNEYYYIVISILILVLNKNIYWTIAFIVVNLLLFLLSKYSRRVYCFYAYRSLCQCLAIRYVFYKYSKQV